MSSPKIFQISCAIFAIFVGTMATPLGRSDQMPDCGLPDTIENGQVHVGGTNLGATRDVTCNNGYKRCGPRMTSCSLDGWTPLPICVEPSCNCSSTSSGPSRFFAIKGKYTWHDAEKQCYSHGARLAIIKSLDDDSAVKALAASGTIVWTCNGHWIGASASDEYSPYLWTDNSPMTINSWGGGLPDRLGCGQASDGVRMCVRIAQQGIWDDIGCNSATGMDGAICERLATC